MMEVLGDIWGAERDLTCGGYGCVGEGPSPHHGGEGRSLGGQGREAVLEVVAVASGRQGRGLGQGRLPGFIWFAGTRRC